jgi:hypothetical protein
MYFKLYATLKLRKMRRLISITVLLSLLSFSGKSQDPEFEYYNSREIRTLLGHDRSGGAYGSFTLGYSVIDNDKAVILGGRLSWIANHYIGVGIGGTGFINEFHYEPGLNREVALTGGYGGLYIEPILFPRAPVHLSFPVLFGAGGISYISNHSDFNENFIEDSEAFLMIEPAAELELNLTRFFRLAFGTSYRFPTAFDVGLIGIPAVNAKSLKGFSYTITLKFGRF